MKLQERVAGQDVQDPAETQSWAIHSVDTDQVFTPGDSFDQVFTKMNAELGALADWAALTAGSMESVPTGTYMASSRPRTEGVIQYSVSPGGTSPDIEDLERRLVLSNLSLVQAHVRSINDDAHAKALDIALLNDSTHGEVPAKEASSDHRASDTAEHDTTHEEALEHHEHHVHHDVKVHEHHGVLVIRSATLHGGRAAIHHKDGSELAIGSFEHHGEVHIAAPREHGTYTLVFKDKEHRVVATVIINVKVQGVEVGEVEHEHEHEHDHEEHDKHEHEHEHEHEDHKKHDDHPHSEHEHEHEHKHDHYHEHQHAHEDHIHAHSAFHGGHAHAAHDEAHEGHGHGHGHDHGGEAHRSHENPIPLWELLEMEAKERARLRVLQDETFIALSALPLLSFQNGFNGQGTDMAQSNLPHGDTALNIQPLAANGQYQGRMGSMRRPSAKKGKSNGDNEDEGGDE